MTTDVTNVQNAYQMILRMCTRAPVMLLCAMAAAFSISARLSLIFVAAIAFLGVALFFITKNSSPRISAGIPQIRRPQRQRAG